MKKSIALLLLGLVIAGATASASAVDTIHDPDSIVPYLTFDVGGSEFIREEPNGDGVQDDSLCITSVPTSIPTGCWVEISLMGYPVGEAMFSHPNGNHVYVSQYRPYYKNGVRIVYSSNSKKKR